METEEIKNSKHEHICSLKCYIDRQSKALTYEDVSKMYDIIMYLKNHLRNLKYSTKTKANICVSACEEDSYIEDRLLKMTEDLKAKEEKIKFKQEGLKEVKV